MDSATSATYVVGAGAILMAGVQALIYNAQRKAQNLANKQALFERRMKAFRNVSQYVDFYIENDGNVNPGPKRDAYDDAIADAPHIFSKQARAAFKSVELRLDEHAKAKPIIQYDDEGSVVRQSGPHANAELAKLKMSRGALPNEVADDLNLT